MSNQTPDNITVVAKFRRERQFVYREVLGFCEAHPGVVAEWPKRETLTLSEAQRRQNLFHCSGAARTLKADGWQIQTAVVPSGLPVGGYRLQIRAVAPKRGRRSA